MGDLGRAQELFNDALQLSRDAKHLSTQSKTLTNLAALAATNQHPDEALELLEQALAQATEDGDTIGVSRIAYNRGRIQIEVGDTKAAKASLEEAARTAQKIGWSEGLDRLYEWVSDHRALFR